MRRREAIAEKLVSQLPFELISSCVQVLSRSIFPYISREREHLITELVHSAEISKAPGAWSAWCSESALMSIHVPGLANRITPGVLMCKIVSAVCETTALAGYLDTSVVWMRRQMNIEIVGMEIRI